MTASDRTITFNNSFAKPPGEAKADWLIFTELANHLGYGKHFSYKSEEEIFDELKQCTKGRPCDISSFTYGDFPKRWGKRWLYEELKFPTQSSKAIMFATPYDYQEADFILITGRTKNQWHTMTRTGKSEELLKGEEEPFLIINKEDAHELGVVEGDMVEVFSKDTSLRMRVKFGEVKRKHIFAPFGYGFSYQAVINTLTSDLTESYIKTART